MKLHWKGKYSGNEADLPQKEHPRGYVPYKEPGDMKKMAIVANLLSFGVLAVFAVPLVLLGWNCFIDSRNALALGAILPILTMLPHELLHALCFLGDVDMYTNLKQGLCFVVGTEDMTKSRFIFMSMLPTIIFGFVPYIAFLCCPSLVGLGVFGALCVSMGAGDFMNVYNTLTQVPKGALVYMSGMHSYWYMPKER